MDKNSEFRLLLRGREFKKMADELYSEFRDRYGLKQVEVDVLVYLGAYPDKSSTEIAKELYLHKGHVSLATDGLCRKGYLLAEHDRNDRRYVRYEITAEGEKVYREIAGVRDRIDSRIFNGFSEAEKRTVMELGRRILDNIASLHDRN